eukprot:3052826-Rhodomonas_salina.1
MERKDSAQDQNIHGASEGSASPTRRDVAHPIASSELPRPRPGPGALAISDTRAWSAARGQLDCWISRQI